MIYNQTEQVQAQSQFHALNLSAIKQNDSIENVQLNDSDDIDIRQIEFPLDQQIQINNNQNINSQKAFIDDSSGEPIQGSFMKEMQQFGKTIIYQDKRYNIYSDSILNSSNASDSSNKSFKQAILEFLYEKNECTDDQTTFLQKTQPQKQLKINLTNFEQIYLKYIVNFENNQCYEGYLQQY